MSNKPGRQRRRRNASSGGVGVKNSRATERARSLPAKAELELSTLQNLRTIFGTVRRFDIQVRHLAGISGSQLWALSEIARDGGLRVNDVSERMGIHQTTASNIINVLVERNLIRRGRDDSDQRVVRLRVTAHGRKMLLRAPGPYAGLLVDALRHLKSPELARLSHALDVLAGTLRSAAPDTAGQPLMGE